MNLSPTLRQRYAERDEQTADLFAELAAASTPQQEAAIVDEIVHLYLGTCATMAGRYDNRGVEHDDLVQVARLALIKAIHRYEPGKAPSFAAYAVPTISGELKRHFRDRAWMVRPPRKLQDLRTAVQLERQRIEQEYGHSPTVSELAQALEVPLDQMSELLSSSTSFRPISIDQVSGSDDGPVMDASLAMVDAELEAVVHRVDLAGALSSLPEQDRRLIVLRFVEGLSQDRIGEVLGMSQMRVSRSLKRIVLSLRAVLDDGEAARVPARHTVAAG
ncbi:sigma-70 family RNA polymerase sigma factor [Terracoccus luteus]|jgi:RNA polymerase sigma-B factor|uniref:RNA polymerase sigma-28 (SigD/FliA/WhiG) subunit n=1 Tax=Terracoccus luteus TaxID=53356 RepID=A0A495XQQ7_9MICO|nr:sigma-70 family RNA polymerase sigma factor [Terracoccus luteus]MBB2986800.1 RNA polymerase sigma-B factor [Terracoccus luteus]MCP2172451.1 RNA polymerase sigma-B factor [Terracoccus luteus]RKT76850.1 RNA polymerase sigma-28 (SigD/FliA/WhiG) subunit [Terracoccus luteus]